MLFRSDQTYTRTRSSKPRKNKEDQVSVFTEVASAIKWLHDLPVRYEIEVPTEQEEYTRSKKGYRRKKITFSLHTALYAGVSRPVTQPDVAYYPVTTVTKKWQNYTWTLPEHAVLFKGTHSGYFLSIWKNTLDQPYVGFFTTAPQEVMSWDQLRFLWQHAQQVLRQDISALDLQDSRYQS